MSEESKQSKKSRWPHVPNRGIAEFDETVTREDIGGAIRTHCANHSQQVDEFFGTDAARNMHDAATARFRKRTG